MAPASGTTTRTTFSCTPTSHCVTSQQALKPTATLSPSVLMDIDASRARDLHNLCYRCKQPGHRKHKCPHRYNMHFMMCVEDFKEEMNEIVLERDKAALGSTSEPSQASEDFRTSDE